jgi:hypothetical protein
MNLIAPRRLVFFCLSFVLVSAVLAQTIPPKEATLHAAGRKTILAIAHGDFAYISSIVDPQGILIGYDGVKHSAASFRDDLAHHTGLYCELFEKDCKTDHNPGYTLGHVLMSGSDPLNADLQFKIDKDNGTLDYMEPGGGDLIATLSYRFAGGKWYLYNIHYV